MASLKINARTFYKLSLLLPVFCSAVGYPFLFVGTSLPRWLRQALGLAALSGVVAAIPYMVLVVLLLLWARSRTEKQFLYALLVSPILMLPLFSLYLLAIALILDRQSLGWQTFDDLVFYVPWVVGIGYGYVLLALICRFIFRRLGVISSSNAI
jgi:hypothetical protein